MSSDPIGPANRSDQAVERLLQAAAVYEPGSAMPDGLVRRALENGRTAKRWTLFVPVAAVAAVGLAGVLILATFAGNSAKNQPLDPIAAAARKVTSALPARSQNAPAQMAWRKHPASAEIAGEKVSSLKPRNRTVISRLSHSQHAASRPNRRSTRQLAAAVRTRRARRPAPRVWRTEIEQSDVIGYIAPAYLAGPADANDEVELRGAALAVTIHTSTTICRPPVEPVAMTAIAADRSKSPKPATDGSQGEQ